MQFTGLDLPDIRESDLSDAKERKKILEYLYQLTEQLRMVLGNIGEDNLSSDLVQIIRDGDGSEEMMSAIEQNAKAIRMTVKRGKIISEINQSAEEIKIKAEKISLEGLVTVNKGFEIREDGSMKATAGSLGAFSADAAGNLAGAASLKVGGMTLSGTKAAGLKIGVDNLSYVNGQPAGSNDAYFLMVTDTGVMCLADLYIQNGQLAITTPGSAPSQTGTTNVVMISSAGDSLSKWSNPSTSSTHLGTCRSGEVYNYTGSLTSSEGYMWAYCSRQYTYNSSTARWVATNVTPFYIPQSSGGEVFFDITTVNT